MHLDRVPDELVRRCRIEEEVCVAGDLDVDGSTSVAIVDNPKVTDVRLLIWKRTETTFLKSKFSTNENKRTFG